MELTPETSRIYGFAIRNPQFAICHPILSQTLSRDRGPKLLAYAKGKIPVYWIVNLVERRVEVYSRPIEGGYASREDFLPGLQLPVMIGGQLLPPIAVDDILP
jgi:Uma2 family endonuclease